MRTISREQYFPPSRAPFPTGRFFNSEVQKQPQTCCGCLFCKLNVTYTPVSVKHCLPPRRHFQYKIDNIYPSGCMSCSWVPRSMMLPCSSTMMQSHSGPWRGCGDHKGRSSVHQLIHTFLNDTLRTGIDGTVASSGSAPAGSATAARAMARSCRCP